MHPDLLNNSHFLRYYNLWQEDPSSIVFAPIAEYLLSYGLIDEALKVCLAGLQYHPQLVSGHLILAKIYLRQKKWDEVKKETQIVLNLVPNHEKAVELQNSFPKKAANWETVTMAKIYAAQGHVDQAAEVYQIILSREPHNEEAKRGLSELQSDNR